MPIYEYQCGECTETFEELVRHSDPTPPCPSCDDAEAVSRLISRTSFQLKGSGWYATDYKSTPSSKNTDSAAPSSSESASASSTSESSSTSDD